MVKVKLSQAEYNKMMAARKGAPKDTQNVKTYYGGARPMSDAPKRHLERRAQNVAIREKSVAESTPLGRVEKRVTGKTRVTSAGRGVVHKARAVRGAVGERIAPVRKAAQPFVADIRTMLGGPSSAGPIINMPPPSYYGGIPNYFEQPRRPPAPPRQAKRKRRVVEREPEPEPSPWEAMSQMPAHARQWWM